jgi:hypothetical protein
MKKLLSFAIFAALLIWTWNIVHRETNLGFETHAGIQAQLEQMIQAAVMSKKPTASDFNMEKLWTEPIAANKVKAHFSYSFKDSETPQDTVQQFIQGEAILYREAPQMANPADNANKTDRWVLQSIKTTSDSLIFSEGALLNTDSSTPSAEPGSTPEPPTQPITK